jgi:hypothetical protein
MFAIAAGFFAIAQAVAFGAFRQSHITGIKLVLLGLIAALAVGALAVCGYHLANAEEPDEQMDIDPVAIERWAREHDDHDFGRMLVMHLRDVAEARAHVNKTRATRYGSVEAAARFALIVTAVELVVAIAFRL